MLTREEDVDAHALRRQGWTISAIARHLGRDRKTIRDYLNNERTPGQRRQPPDACLFFRTAGSDWRMIRICGHRRCSTR
ncbi:helix-turn-helix domain-containing protein [Streptomyces sp. NPDC058409]|uniref:helix-turn-helix domain-containing protein n=1 Tax=Streptomyces sp. NPDC058409 TaxID=3346484 RepID=UPI00366407EF